MNTTGHVYVGDDYNYRVQVFMISETPPTQPSGIPGFPVIVLLIAAGFATFYLTRQAKRTVHT